MPKINEQDLFRLHLKARELSERALITDFTRSDDRTFAERMITVEMAALELLAALGVETPK